MPETFNYIRTCKRCKHELPLTEFNLERYSAEYCIFCRKCSAEFDIEVRERQRREKEHDRELYRNSNCYFRTILKNKGFTAEQIKDNPILLELQKVYTKTKRELKKQYHDNKN